MAEKRRKDTHKGDYGHLFILGGSPGLTGAVCLAGNAALRSGCGLVTIGIPESLNDIIEIKLTEVMTLPLPETSRRTFSLKALESTLAFIENSADAVLIGPGISCGVKETVTFVEQIAKETEKPLVIDADAIKAVSTHKSILKKCRNTVLTPHPGEMSYLTGKTIQDIQRKRKETAVEFAETYGVTIVLKGYRTIVTDGKETCINLTGNPGMATAGSGDVLAGIIGSLIVQGYDAFNAAKWGAHIHGIAGDLAAEELGETSLIASDIIKKLSSSFRKIQKKIDTQNKKL